MTTVTRFHRFSDCSQNASRRSARRVLINPPAASGFGKSRTLSLRRRMTESGPGGVIRSIYSTCLSPLVTDRVMGAWYHASTA
jgi:hypothetical protein